MILIFALQLFLDIPINKIYNLADSSVSAKDKIKNSLFDLLAQPRVASDRCLINTNFSKYFLSASTVVCPQTELSFCNKQLLSMLRRIQIKFRFDVFSFFIHLSCIRLERFFALLTWVSSIVLHICLTLNQYALKLRSDDINTVHIFLNQK